MGRSLKNPAQSDAQSVLPASPLVGPSSGDRPEPSDPLTEEELTEIRVGDIAFGNAEELGWQ